MMFYINPWENRIAPVYNQNMRVDPRGAMMDQLSHGPKN